MKTKNILIDTSVILDGIDNVKNIAKNANVFVTDVILRELDGNKGAEGTKGYNAREFFRQMNGNEFTGLSLLPLNNREVNHDDTLTVGSINGDTSVYALARKWYRAKDINDSRIIEIAKDYGLILQTIDQAQAVRAKAQGIEVEMLKINTEAELLKMDIVLSVSFILLGSFFLISFAGSLIKNGDPFFYFIPLGAGIYILGLLVKKIIASTGSSLRKVFAISTIIGSMIAFINADINSDSLSFIGGFILYVIGMFAIARLKINFKFISKRYEHTPYGSTITFPSDSDNKQQNWMDKTMMMNGVDCFGKNDTTYYL